MLKQYITNTFPLVNSKILFNIFGKLLYVL